MSSGLSSAFLISQKIIREGQGKEPFLSEALERIKERREQVLAELEKHENLYLRQMECGYAHAISAIHEAQSLKIAYDAGETLPPPPKPRTRISWSDPAKEKSNLHDVSRELV